MSVGRSPGDTVALLVVVRRRSRCIRVLRSAGRPDLLGPLSSIVHRRAPAVPVCELRAARFGAIVHAGGLFDPLQGLRLMEQLRSIAPGASARAGEGGSEAQRDDGDGIGHVSPSVSVDRLWIADSTIAGGSHGPFTR